MKRLFFNVLFLSITICYSQEYTNSSTQLALGNSGTAMVDLNSNNIGVIGFCNHSEISSTTIQRQNLSELNEYFLCGVYKSSFGVFRIRSIYSGYSLYKEGGTHIGFSKKVGKTISLGAEINTNYTSIETYSTKLNINASIGALFLLSDNLNYGIQISPGKSTSNKTSYVKRNDALISTGLTYHEDDFLINLDFVKLEHLNSPSIRLGIEYVFYKTLFVRIGTSFKPYNLSGGFGYKHEKLRFDFGYSSHEYIQNIYGLSIRYTFEN